MKTAILGNLSPFTKIIFVLMLLLTGMILTLGIGILLAIPLFHVNLLTNMDQLSDLSNPVSVSLLKYLQVVQSIGIFIIPPMLAGFLFERNTLGYTGLKVSPKVTVLFMVVLLMIASLPFINWIVSVNEAMKLPLAFKGIEQWMKEAEDQASHLTDAFLDARTAGGLAVNLIVIALLPAMGEELLFRGLLQRLFREWFRNVHVAIFITAFIFAVIHMQFYGLLPRMLLGIIFGYLFYWTGSIWVPAFAHFLNNGVLVVIAYLTSRNIIGSEVENFGVTENFLLIAGSLLFSALILFFVYKYQKQFPPLPVDNEHPDDQVSF